MKLVAMVMAVVEVNGRQSVTTSLGIAKNGEFNYMGSFTCDFEQFGFVNSMLKKVPDTFLDYRNKKWNDYINKIMMELASL